MAAPAAGGAALPAGGEPAPDVRRAGVGGAGIVGDGAARFGAWPEDRRVSASAQAGGTAPAARPDSLDGNRHPGTPPPEPLDNRFRTGFDTHNLYV